MVILGQVRLEDLQTIVLFGKLINLVFEKNGESSFHNKCTSSYQSELILYQFSKYFLYFIIMLVSAFVVNILVFFFV